MLQRIQHAIVLLLVVRALAPANTPELPKTVPGKRMMAMLRAFNGGHEHTIRDFIEDNYSARALKEVAPEQRASTYLALRAEIGEFELRKVEDSGEHSITVLVEATKTEAWYRITCAVDLASPHLIIGMTLREIPRPAEIGAQRNLNDQQMAAELERYVTKLAQEGIFSGVIEFAKKGEPIFQKAVPPTSAGKPVDLETRFALGSINKTFIAVAVAQLQEQKKLGFLDRVSKFLPEFGPRGERITIQQLLTHTSGMEPFADAKSVDDLRQTKVATAAELARFLGSRPAVAEPGEKFVYSNAGYMLLEALVQVVSGEPLEKYLRAHIFTPAGMTSTANGYSNAHDMTAFGTALLAGTLLPPDLTKFVTAGKVRTNDPQVMYGFGFEERTINASRIIGHAAAGPDISNQIDMYPDLGYTLVVLSSQPGHTAERVANRVRGMMEGRSPNFTRQGLRPGIRPGMRP